MAAMSRLCVAGVILASTLAPRPAFAQLGGGDITVGYSLVTNDALAKNSSTMPLGWYTSGSVRMTPVLSIAWAASGAADWGIQPSSSLDGVIVPGRDVEFQGLSLHRPETLWCSPVERDCDVQIWSVAGGIGPRFTLQTGGVRPFVQFLSGWSRVTRQIDRFTHAGTNFTLMPGGGLDFEMTERLGLRIQGDYAHAFVPRPEKSKSSLQVADGRDFKEFRLGIGLKVRINSWWNWD